MVLIAKRQWREAINSSLACNRTADITVAPLFICLHYRESPEACRFAKLII